ncbi:hypothetical protein Tco_0345831 [Tanacetum coccineum]
MYRPSFDSPSPSPQPNQGYSPLNRINLDMDMENLFNTQYYYAGQALGQGSGGNQDFYMGQDNSMAHGSAHDSDPIESNSPVKEVAPVKAKKNKSGSCDLTMYQKECAEYAVEYDHDFTLDPCWEILKDNSAQKEV